MPVKGLLRARAAARVANATCDGESFPGVVRVVLVAGAVTSEVTARAGEEAINEGFAGRAGDARVVVTCAGAGLGVGDARFTSEGTRGPTRAAGALDRKTSELGERAVDVCPAFSGKVDISERAFELEAGFDRVARTRDEQRHAGGVRLQRGVQNVARHGERPFGILGFAREGSLAAAADNEDRIGAFGPFDRDVAGAFEDVRCDERRELGRERFGNFVLDGESFEACVF